MAQIAAPRADTAGLTFVERSAVFAGAVLAAALTFVLLTFGTAIGLSTTSPWRIRGSPPRWSHRLPYSGQWPDRPPRYVGPGAFHLRRATAHAGELGSVPMIRDVILWVAGVPISVIILLHLVGVLH